MKHSKEYYINIINQRKESPIANNTILKKDIAQLSFAFQLSYQQTTIFINIFEDAILWNMKDIFLKKALMIKENLTVVKDSNLKRKKFFNEIASYYKNIKQTPPSYKEPVIKPKRSKLTVLEKKDKTRKIFGDCPVASEKTVCCNLKTIDSVTNCGFACSYCTIQTFYGTTATFDKDLAEKLNEINLDKNKFYHIGTGQSSDSLLWGNKFQVLDNLMSFAKKHPNILLELKTKSANITYLINNKLPPNVVVSWSLNTEEIIKNEEHFTANLKKRINAAIQLKEHNIAIAFHIHPMIYYDNWENGYGEIATLLLTNFNPEDVAFISFGSLTFIKPVIKAIRGKGINTKILQSDFVKDPHGKLTYKDSLKIEMYRYMFNKLESWHNKVFFYLCMEKANIWDQVFGWHFLTNEAFNDAFKDIVMPKIYKLKSKKPGKEPSPLINAL